VINYSNDIEFDAIPFSSYCIFFHSLLTARITYSCLSTIRSYISVVKLHMSYTYRILYYVDIRKITKWVRGFKIY